MTMDRIRAGDIGALELLLRDVWPPLVAHLAAVTGSLEAAEDAAQEAFVRLWERREDWRAGSARALLFRIGRNAALDEGRRARVRGRLAAERSRSGVASPPTPDGDLDRSELRLRLDAALDRLPPRRREVFELIRFSGLSHEEAADAMGLATQTVANHMSLALRDLRAALADLVAGMPRSGSGEPGEPEGRRRDG